jgi:hypothetical protein
LCFRHINFANATPNELEQLSQACEVFEEARGTARKMDPKCFSSSLDPFRTDLIRIIRGYLLEGEESTKSMEVEAYELNIYGAYLIFIRPYLTLYCCPGKGSSIKPHVDTLRREKIFGSLVVVLPTLHEGGACSYGTAVTNGSSTLARSLQVARTDGRLATWHSSTMWSRVLHRSHRAIASH